MFMRKLPRGSRRQQRPEVKIFGQVQTACGGEREGKGGPTTTFSHDDAFTALVAMTGAINETFGRKVWLNAVLPMEHAPAAHAWQGPFE